MIPIDISAYNCMMLSLFQLLISAPVLIFKLEGGIGHSTVPLLIVEAAFSGKVNDWSSQVFVLIKQILGNFNYFFIS